MARSANDDDDGTAMAQKVPDQFTFDSMDDEIADNGIGINDKGHTRNDRYDMQRLGKDQELMRNFRPLSALSFTMLLQGTWEFLLIANTQALVDGGLAGLFWTYFWTFFGFGIVMLSLAEMSSMAPTSGGQYHWVSEFAPPQYQRGLSYMTGWLSTLSWQAGSASGSFLTGTIIQALITLNNPDYVPKNWQGTLLVFAMTVVIFIANTYGAKHMPTIQNILLVVYIFGFLTIIIILWVLAPTNQASVVFGSFDNQGGWGSMAVALMVGQISAIFGSTCSDATAHMAEEVRDASWTVPNAMCLSYLLNGILGFVLVITYLFTLTDITAALEDPTYYPFIWVFRQALSTGGVNVLTGMLLVLVTASNITFNASTARQTWAFARDRGLPMADWLGAVDPKLHIPYNSVVASCLLTCLIALLNLGSAAAFNAIISLQVCALMFSYFVSISCVLYRRIVHPEFLPAARWSLGRWGIPVNAIGVGYSLFAFFWSFWPNATPVDTTTFNWAVVIFLGIALVSLVWYFAEGRKHYRGPVVTVQGRH